MNSETSDAAGAVQRSALASITAELGVDASPAQLDTLLGYLALLQRWNRTYNLTSVRDPGQMVTHHLADCIATLAPLRRAFGSRARRLLDVGSGAGLPGVVIAILAPELAVTCVDSVGKKAAFVQQVAGELRIPNMRSVHSRVEQLPEAHFDIVTSRAFASLSDFVSLTTTRLAPDGVWMAMKGTPPLDEIAALPTSIDVFHVEPLQIPHLNAARCLVWMRRRKLSAHRPSL